MVLDELRTVPWKEIGVSVQRIQISTNPSRSFRGSNLTKRFGVTVSPYLPFLPGLVGHRPLSREVERDSRP